MPAGQKLWSYHRHRLVRAKTLESAELQDFQWRTMGDVYANADTEADSRQGGSDRLLAWSAVIALALALLVSARRSRRR
jgi:hypothetical protein